MPAMDDSFDMVFLVGYHAGAGEAASSMDHTYSGASVQNVYINGQLMNEGTINSAYAGIVHKVPVGLIIGDSGLERQMKGEGMMPWPEFVCTKQSLSRFSAVYKPKKLLKEETIAPQDVRLNLKAPALPKSTMQSTVLPPCPVWVKAQEEHR